MAQGLNLNKDFGSKIGGSKIIVAQGFSSYHRLKQAAV